MSAMAKKTEPIKEVASVKPVKEKRQLKEVKTEDEEQLEIIDYEVGNRKYWGKPRGEVKIHGVQFAGPNNNLNGNEGYSFYSSEGVYPGATFTALDSKFKFEAFKNHVNTGGSSFVPEGLDFSDSLAIVYIEDPKNPGITRIMIHGPNNQYDASRRNTNRYTLFCDMPTKTFNDLKELIVGNGADKSGNPDNAERFIEMAFEGIDQTDIGRNSVQSVYLVDLDNYIPDLVANNGMKKGWMQSLDEARRKGLYNVKGAVISRKFSRSLPEFEEA